VQEAAKVIGDSVDKSAKIIFGIMRDDKLKKGQIRIIVIATGFPESEAADTTGAAPGGFERSLFAMPAKEQEESRGKIFNDVLRRAAPAVEEPASASAVEEAPREMRPEPIVTAQPKAREEAPKTVTPPSASKEGDEEDEAWGAIPSFLRRHKK
jgi:hypothetical protein